MKILRQVRDQLAYLWVCSTLNQLEKDLVDELQKVQREVQECVYLSQLSCAWWRLMSLHSLFEQVILKKKSFKSDMFVNIFKVLGTELVEKEHQCGYVRGLITLDLTQYMDLVLEPPYYIDLQERVIISLVLNAEYEFDDEVIDELLEIQAHLLASDEI